MNVSLEQHKKNLEDIAKLLSEQKRCALVIAPKDEKLRKDIDDQQNKTKEKFKVLVVGTYNAGKSSMLNALAGKDFLPTGDLPETGVITEIIYGEKPRLTLYPKKKYGTEPIILDNPDPDTFKKYCSIDNEGLLDSNNANTENMRYERVVVESDLPLLKDGIVLIDTVGMNDPWGNDYITQRYLPLADAIIYLMNSTQIYTNDDKELLEQINQMGLRDLIVAYTRFGIVAQNNRRKPAELEKFCKVARAQASRHTDIGDEGVFFIDSLDALGGKEKNDHDVLVRSGFVDFENFCYRYLTEEKGRIKVNALTGMMQQTSLDLIKRSEQIKVGANTALGELQERVKEAREMLGLERSNAENSVTRFETSISQQLPALQNNINAYMSTLANRVNLDNYNFKNKLPRGGAKLLPWQANKMAKLLQEECAAEIQRRMNAEVKRWAASELREQVQAIVERGVDKISVELRDFFTQMEEIDAKLNSGYQKERKQQTILNVAGIAAGLVLGGVVGAGSIAAYGVEDGAKAIAGQAAGAMAAGFIAGVIGAPVTLPIAIGGAVIGGIIALLTGDQDKREQKIKAKVLANYRAAYNEDLDGQRKTADSIYRSCVAITDRAVENLRLLQERALKEKEDTIAAMLEINQKDSGEQQRIISQNDEAIANLRSIIGESTKISAQYQK